MPASNEFHKGKPHNRRTKPIKRLATPFDPHHRKLCVVLQSFEAPLTDPIDIIMISKMVLTAFAMHNLKPLRFMDHYVQFESKDGYSRPQVSLYANETGELQENEDSGNIQAWPRYFAGVEDGRYFIMRPE